MKTKLKLLIGLSLLAFSHAALAQDDAGGSSSLSQSRFAASSLRKSVVPAIDLSYGYLDQGGAVDADGDAVSIMAVGTHYFDRSFWLADMGVGFHQQNLSRDTRDQALGLVALSGRYRFPYEWSFGPTVAGFIGNAEAFGRDDYFTAMAGAVGFKDFVVRRDQIVRVGLRYMTDIATSNQTSNYIGLAVEVTAPRLWRGGAAYAGL